MESFGIIKHLASYGFTNLFLLSLLLYTASLLLTVLYNLYLHPLHHFPGPRPAAAIPLFELYHNAYRRGQLLPELQRLHSLYGPVIRIAPNELHFSSPSAYPTIHSPTPTFIKTPSFYDRFNNPHTSFTESHPFLARKRRDIITPHFARKNVLKMQGVVQEALDHLIAGFRTAAKKGGCVDVYAGYRSVGLDVIGEFICGRAFGMTQIEGFRGGLVGKVEKAVRGQWAGLYCPAVRWGWGDGAGFLGVLEDVRKGLEAAKEGKGVVVSLREAGLTERLVLGECVSLLFAGGHTVGNTLMIGTVEVLRNEGVQERLLKELKTVWPGLEGEAPGLEVLEKLPYLAGVIKESLRLSHGVIHPLPRTATKDVVIDGYHVPAGTQVGISGVFVHKSPKIFPEPDKFDPLRWADGGEDLSKWLVAFSKGVRKCPGASLGNCELFLTFANVFRRFKLELEGFEEKDIQMSDYFSVYYAGRCVHVSVEERRE